MNLKKLLSEAKTDQQQINIIAEAICEDPDLVIDKLIEEGTVDELTALFGYVAGVAKQIVRGKPGIDERLAKLTGKQYSDVALMTPEEKRALLLKSMDDLMGKAWDDTQRGMHDMGL